MMFDSDHSLASEYHRERFLKYVVEDGLLQADATEKANEDLAEWNTPLPLPDTPDIWDR